MNNLEKYNRIFEDIFEVQSSQLNKDFSLENVDKWDSITQLSLVSEMEEVFDIMMDSDDILNFKSYENGKSIIAKYDIVL